MFVTNYVSRMSSDHMHFTGSEPSVSFDQLSNKLFINENLFKALYLHVWVCRFECNVHRYKILVVCRRLTAVDEWERSSSL